MSHFNDHTLSRRDFVGLVAMTAAVPVSRAWAAVAGPRLSARPGKPTEAWKAGLTPLWEAKPGAFLYIPKSYDPATPIPLVLGLHGAGQRSNVILRVWTPQADAAGFALLAVESTGMTWDAIRGTYGDDPVVIDRALRLTFERINVDPRRVVLEGFSDGASYGLGLALNNRDLFTKVVANSPGFITFYEKRQPGPKPRIYVSHGRQDRILPYEYAGPRVVRQLRSEGFSVEFRDFEGGHTIPVDVAQEVARFIVK